jgi:hypothetical protein
MSDDRGPMERYSAGVLSLIGSHRAVSPISLIGKPNCRCGNHAYAGRSEFSCARLAAAPSKAVQTALRNVTTLGLAAANSRSSRCQFGNEPGVRRPSTRGVRAPVIAVALAGV